MLYFFLEIGRFEKRIALFEKKPPLAFIFEIMYDSHMRLRRNNEIWQ